MGYQRRVHGENRLLRMKTEALENKNNELMQAIHEIRSKANHSGISSDSRMEINEESVTLKKMNTDLNRRNEQLIRREKDLLEQLINKNHGKKRSSPQDPSVNKTS